MFGIGPNTLLLNLHGLFMILMTIFSAFLFGAIYFSHEASPQLVYRLKVSSIVAFLMLIGLIITGIIPDIAMGTGAAYSHSTTNAFGTFTATVTDDQVANFTGPLLFDMMEHTSLILPGLAAVIGFVILYFGGRVITDPTIKRSVLSLMLLTAAWTLGLAFIGVYITKVLTLPMSS